jgi:hypothetical protein
MVGTAADPPLERPPAKGSPQLEQKRCCAEFAAEQRGQITVAATRPVERATLGEPLGRPTGICDATANSSVSAISVACWKRSPGIFSNALSTTACTAGEMRGLIFDGGIGRS